MKPFRARKREKVRGVFVSRRTYVFSPKKKIQSKNTRTKTTKLIGLMRIARNMHHKDTYLCLKQTPISHLNASQGMTQLLRVRVCVSPGGPPEGILDRAEYVVSRVFFLLV